MRRAHIGHTQPTNNAVRRDASPLECSGDFRHGLFAGVGTVGEAAARLDRRFVLFEISKDYMNEIKNRVETWLREDVVDVNWINCEPVKPLNRYLEYQKAEGRP